MVRLARRKAIVCLIGLAVIVLIAGIDRALGLLPVQSDWHRYHGQWFEVVHVVDGDTLDLRVKDGDKPTTRVRLWGVDTPELSKPGSTDPAEPLAEEATEYVRGLVEGERVKLLLQRHRTRGVYGRLLCYVQLPDGTVLNARLIEAGYSKHETRWSHDQQDRYQAIEARARKAGLRVWAD